MRKLKPERQLLAQGHPVTLLLRHLGPQHHTTLEFLRNPNPSFHSRPPESEARKMKISSLCLKPHRLSLKQQKFLLAGSHIFQSSKQQNQEQSQIGKWNLFLITTYTVSENFHYLYYITVARTRDQIANIRWIIEKARGFHKNIYFCFIDYAKVFDCVDHKKLWRILKEMGVPDHLTCLLRNLYAGQEAIVRIGHGTTDWFKIRERIMSKLYIVILLI